MTQVPRHTESPLTVTATAVLQKAQQLPPGTDILPITVPEEEWADIWPGETWSIYGDGKIRNEGGDQVPGNFGTLDIGLTNNSTKDLVRQINSGLSDSDVQALYSDDRTDNPGFIGATEQFWANADTGLSAGMKSAVIANQGRTKLIPIYRTMNSAPGNNLEYFVVGWGVVQIGESNWKGGNSKRYLNVKKAYMYDEDLTPAADLSETVNIIQAAYTSPVLVWPTATTVSEDDEG